MLGVLSRYVSSFKYTQLGQSPDANPTRLQLHTFRLLSSKRLGILAAATLLILLLPAAVYFTTPHTGLDLAGVSRGWPFGSNPQDVTGTVDWSRFAYTQYATNAPYLCNSVMLFEILHRLGSKPERLLMYPSEFVLSGAGVGDESKESLLLRKARDEYNVKLQPIGVVRRNSNDRKLEMLFGVAG
jgi:hypothetical protein